MAKKNNDRASLVQYVEFLKKRLASKNYKANVSAEEYSATKEKYDKAKLRLKLLRAWLDRMLRWTTIMDSLPTLCRRA